MSLRPLTCARLTYRYSTLPIPPQSARIITTLHFPLLQNPSHKSTQAPQRKRPKYLSQHLRSFHTTLSPMTEQFQKKDWSATQYLKFGNERTRAVYDLVSQVAPHITSPTPRIYDLGKLLYAKST